MGLNEFTESPEVAQQAEVLAKGLLRARISEIRNRTDRYYDRLFRVRVDDTSKVAHDLARPPALLGAGILALSEDEDRPLVVANLDILERKLPTGIPIPLPDAEEVWDHLATSIRQPLSESTVVLALTGSRAQYAPGGLISYAGSAAGVKTATLGAQVIYRGNDAILTAGHAAPQGASVTDDQGNAGRVAFSIDPAMLPAQAISADVAVVETTDWTKSSLVIGSSDFPKRRDGIVMEGGPSGRQSGRLHAYCPYFENPAAAGAWGELHLTEAGISQAGDSGAPVFRDGTDVLIGHIVGGAGDIMSYVQDIRTQLAACGAPLRPSPRGGTDA